VIELGHALQRREFAAAFGHVSLGRVSRLARQKSPLARTTAAGWQSSDGDDARAD
jgi:hypothetical protein